MIKLTFISKGQLALSICSCFLYKKTKFIVRSSVSQDTVSKMHETIDFSGFNSFEK